MLPGTPVAGAGAAVEAQGVCVATEKDPAAEGAGGARCVPLQPFEDAGGYPRAPGGLFQGEAEFLSGVFEEAAGGVLRPVVVEGAVGGQ